MDTHLRILKSIQATVQTINLNLMEAVKILIAVVLPMEVGIVITVVEPVIMEGAQVLEVAVQTSKALWKEEEEQQKKYHSEK